MIGSFCLSHCYACPVLSPGCYKSLNAIVVSRATDPSIPVVIMCEITLSLAFSLLFPEEGGGRKKATQIHKIFILRNNLFFTDPKLFHIS